MYLLFNCLSVSREINCLFGEDIGNSILMELFVFFFNIQCHTFMLLFRIANTRTRLLQLLKYLLFNIHLQILFQGQAFN